jgi:hypothetical protein
MSTEWLTIQSFQRSQNLLDAINTLLIHLKLKLMGIKDEESEQALAQAREKLSNFLEFIDKVFNQVQQIEHEPLTGMDPRQRELIRRLSSANKNKKKYRSDLFRKSPKAVEKLLHSKNPQEQKRLIESLAELRILLEEHIGEDTRKVLGEI